MDFRHADNPKPFTRVRNRGKVTPSDKRREARRFREMREKRDELLAALNDVLIDAELAGEKTSIEDIDAHLERIRTTARAAITKSKGIAMDDNAEEILQNVKNAMQAAEEIGGPEGEDYIELMEAIAKEATTRAANARNILNGAG